MFKINFESSGYELVQVDQLGFKVKGSKDHVVIFRQGDMHFVFENKNLDKNMSFLEQCYNIHPSFYKFKYGDDFFKEAKEFHEDMAAYLYSEGEEVPSFAEGYKTYEELAEQDFADGQQPWLYPAVIFFEGSQQEAEYYELVSGKTQKRDKNVLISLLKSDNVAVFCVKKDMSIELVCHYHKDLCYNILRGKGTIGNLIEVEYGDIKVLVECGKELESDQPSRLEDAVINSYYDAAFITHYHLDHAANVHRLKCPVYMGEGCLKVLNAQRKYALLPPLDGVTTYKSGEEITIDRRGQRLKIVSILVDHSAYDSYMLLFEAEGKKILYTGDFRANGRKSFERALEKLPEKVDYLICEATNMYKGLSRTECELEKQAGEIMKKYDRVFVFQAGTNIDRLVSFYKASKRAGKVFLMDSYVATITENLPNVPNVSFNDVYCFTDFPFNLKMQAEWRVQRRHGLGYNDIGSRYFNGKDLSKFTMLVRPSMINYLKRADKDKKQRFGFSLFDRSVLVYSLWEGYKEKENVKKFLDEMEKLNVQIITLHVSGHADKFAIDRLKAKVNPTVIDYVHYIDRSKNEE